MTNRDHGVLNVSGRQCQVSTDYENQARSFNCHWCQDHGISFERSWQTVGPVSVPSHVADTSLTFFKQVRSFSGVTLSLVRLQIHV